MSCAYNLAAGYVTLDCACDLTIDSYTEHETLYDTTTFRLTPFSIALAEEGIFPFGDWKVRAT